MFHIQKLKISKEEIVKKLELMDNRSFKKITTEEYLRRLFTVDFDLKIQQDANDTLRIGNPILRTLNEKTGLYYFKIVNKANLEKVNDYVKRKRVLGNGVAICGKRPDKDLTTAYYSITIDLDWVSERKLQNLLEYIKENNLLVNFITVSGTGLHITFLIEEVNKKQAELLNKIKEKITNFLWETKDNNGEPLFVEPYIFGTNEKNKIQYQSINQGFAMPGSNFKSAFNMPEEYKVSTYLINEKRISLKDLQENIKKVDKQCIYGEIVSENNDERVVQYVKTEDHEKHTDRNHHQDMAKHLISNLIKYGKNLGNGKIIPIGKRRKTTEAIAGMFKSVGVGEKRTTEIIESFANDYYVNNDLTRLYTNKELRQSVKDVYSNKIKTKWLSLNQIEQRTGIHIVKKREKRKFRNHTDYLSSISCQYKNEEYIPGVVKTYNNLLAIKKLSITTPKILTDDKYSLREKINILDSNNINISKSTLRKYLKIINDNKEFAKYCKLAQENKKLISRLDDQAIKEINYFQNERRFILYKHSVWEGKLLLSINTNDLLSCFNFKGKSNLSEEILFVDKDFMEEMINLLRLIKEEQRIPYQLEEVFNAKYYLEEELKDLEKAIKLLGEEEQKHSEKEELIERYEATLHTLENYKTCIYELSLDLKRKTELWNKYYQTYKIAVNKNRVVADETLIKEFNDLMSKVNKKARGFKKLESKPLFNYGLITKKIKELNKELRTFTYNNVMNIDRTKNIIDNFSTYFSNKETEISLYTQGLSNKKEKVVFLSSLLISVLKQYDLTDEFRIRNSVEMKRGNYLWEKVLFLNEIRVLLIKTVKQIVSYDKKTNYKEYETIDKYIKALLDKKRISIGERTNLLSNLITT